MKKQLLLPIGILACSWLTACNEGTNETTNSDTTSTTTSMTTTAGGVSGGMHALSENDTYTDLKTGKTFRVRKDASSGSYVSETGDPLDYYYNPSTNDTFYGPSGRWVNNALIYNPDRTYTIDESRVQMPSGNGSTMMDDDAKIKMNDEELKIKEGDTKIKITDDEAKIKSGDDKMKINEDQTKIKSGDTKVKSNEGETKVKQR